MPFIRIVYAGMPGDHISLWDRGTFYKPDNVDRPKKDPVAKNRNLRDYTTKRKVAEGLKKCCAAISVIGDPVLCRGLLSKLYDQKGRGQNR